MGDDPGQFASVMNQQIKALINETEELVHIYNQRISHSPSLYQDYKESSLVRRRGALIDRRELRSNKTSALDSNVRSYILKVYRHMTIMTGTALAGTIGATYLVASIPSLPIWAFFLSILSLLGYLFSSHKHFFSISMALFNGMLLSVIVAAATAVSATAVPIAVGGTALIFFGFTAAAFFAPSESFLKYGGILISVLLATTFLAVISLFFAIPAMNMAISAMFIMIFSLFIGYDTQKMIKNAKSGANDYVGDAVSLFLDILRIFQELLLLRTGK